MEVNTPLEELVILLDLDQSGAAKFIHFPDLAIEHVLSQIREPNHTKQYTSFYFMVAKNFCDQNELTYDKDLYKAAQQKYGYQSRQKYEPKKQLSNEEKHAYSQQRMSQISDDVVVNGLIRLKNDPIYAQKWARIARYEIPHAALKEIVLMDPIYAQLLPDFV